MTSSILFDVVDPGGNPTALVRTAVPASKRVALAQKILASDMQLEQVGFLMPVTSGKAHICLAMAGGELCGNALRSVGAIYAKETGKTKVFISTSATAHVFEVRVDGGTATLVFPRADIHLEKAICHLDGISHMLMPKSRERVDVHAVLSDAKLLGKKASGVMQYELVSPAIYAISPTVYVRSMGTLIDETACASGTLALAEHLFAVSKLRKLSVRQPSGAIFTTEIKGANILLSGPIQKISSHAIDF